MLESWAPLIYGAVAATFALVGLRIYYGHKLTTAKVLKKNQPAQDDLDISSYIDKVPQMLMAIEGEIAGLKAKGATKEQLASLESKAQILRLVSNVPAPIAKAIAPALVKQALGALKGFGL